MFYFRSLGLIIIGALTLSACAGQQIGQSAGVVPPGQSVLSRITPDKIETCTGTGSVTITGKIKKNASGQCSVTFKYHSRKTVDVTIGGPGVVYSSLSVGGDCDSGLLCYFEQIGPLEWQIGVNSGSSDQCGGATVTLQGNNASEGYVGEVSINVTVKGKHCP